MRTTAIDGLQASQGRDRWNHMSPVTRFVSPYEEYRFGEVMTASGFGAAEDARKNWLNPKGCEKGIAGAEDDVTGAGGKVAGGAKWRESRRSTGSAKVGAGNDEQK